MAEYRKNLANAIVGTMTPSTSATSIPLQAGYGATMPAVPFFMTYTPPGQLSTMGNSEIVLVSAISTDTLTVVRAQKGTTARLIGTGWICSASILRETSLAVGDIIQTLNSTPQTGRVFMAGQTLNKADFPLLYDHVVNNAGYGSTTSTTFTLKDMRGVTTAGQKSTGAFNLALGSSVGTETHTLTTAQVPNATGAVGIHGGENGSQFIGPSGIVSGQGSTAQYKAPPGSTGGSSSVLYGLNFNLGFGGGSHPNIQPTMVINYEVVAS